MKRKVILLMVISIITAILFQTVAFAAGYEEEGFRTNNVDYTVTDFSISSSGNASVYVKYKGISNVTSGATIEITIKKNILIFFWTTVVEESYDIIAESYSHTYNYDLSGNGSGTYKCFVTYTISGSGGADDVIPFEDTASY